MLTPIDIQNRQLKQKMGGYDKKDTDDFLDEVIANYEELYKENQALKEKITSLSEGIQYYKKMEGTLQKALVLAEKTSSETQEAAKSQADSMMTEASVKAEALSRETKAEIDALRAEAQAQAEVTKAKANRELEETRNHVRKLVQSYENYRLQFKKLAEAQIEMLESESFSIFVPELDELMNEAPSADSVLDNPGVIPINIGSPAPFADLSEEVEAEKPAAPQASLVEELPVSIAIPVSSTEPFTAPPADDIENAPSIDLNVSSSVIESMDENKPSIEVDLGTGSAINIPISAGAFVSPDDDIPEENAFVDPSANSVVPTPETPMASAAESPFMDIPGTPVEATVPSMNIPVTPEATVPSMDIPVTPEATVPSMDIPIVPTGEIPVSGTTGNPVESIASSMEVPINPSAGTPMTAIDGIVPSMDTAATNAGAANASPFMEIPAMETPADPSANAVQSPFVDPAANNAFMDIPISQNAAPADQMMQADTSMPAYQGMDANQAMQANTNMAANQALQANPAAQAMNNAFVDIPMETPAENNFANMGMQANTSMAANPGIQANPMDQAIQVMAANPMNPAMQVNQGMDANQAMQANISMAANPAAQAMNNAFVDMPMETPAENNFANMGMQADTSMAANTGMPAYQDMQANVNMAANPMDQAMQANANMAANPMDQAMQANASIAANPMDQAMQANANMAANPMDQAMQANASMAANPATPAMNNAFIDMPMETPAENNNPANMGMQMDNPFMDIPMETPAADPAMMNPAQSAAPAAGMTAAAPQASAPVDNSNLMADPFMDVGSMFDSPINDIPEEQKPEPEQSTQSVESFLDINPFNFIDPE